MEENENKIKVKNGNFGEPYLVEYKGDKILLYESKYGYWLYAQCYGCGHTTYFHPHKDEPDMMIDRYTLEKFLEHKHTCMGIKSINNLNKLIETGSQNTILEAALVREIVKAIYSVADAINNLNE